MYHGCEIVFDSSEVPEQAMAAAAQVADVQVYMHVTPAMAPLRVLLP